MRCLLASCLLFGAGAAGAHSGHSHQIEETTIIGTRQNSVGEAVSASQGVVGQQEIDIRPLMRTGEVLELVPGMVVTQHSGNGKANQYFLRGINLDHGTDFATSVDNMPVNMRTHGHGQGYTDINFIIPETIHQIQYKKGSYYPSVGDFSAAGGAGMVTANSVEQGIAELGFGDHGFTRGLLLNSHEAGGGQWLYALEYAGFDGQWQNTSEDLERFNALLKHSREVKGGLLTIGFMGYDNQWNAADQIPLRAVQQGLISELDTIDTSVGGNSHRYSVDVDWRNQHWQASAYVIDSELQLWSNFTYFLDDPEDGDQFEQIDDRLIYGGQIEYRTKSEWFGTTVQHLLGSQLRHDDIAEAGLYRSQARRRIGTAGGVINSDAIDETSLAFYWRSDWQFTEKLKGILGYRIDSFEFDVNNRVGVNTNGFDLSENGGTESDSLGQLKASLAYQLNASWETYASWGQGFHSNDARGVTIKVDPGSGEAIDTVTPLSRSTSYEFGLRGEVAPKLNTSIAFWWLDQNSELIFVGDAGNTEAGRPSERNGVEFTAYYRLNDNLTLDLEYAYTDAQFQDNAPEGNLVPGAIRDVVQTGVSGQWQNGLYGSVRLRYFGKRPLIEDGSVKSGSSTLVNAKLGWRYKDWDFKMLLLNVFDSDDHDIDYFYASRLEGEPAEGVEDIHYHILEHRSFRFAISRAL